MSNIFEFWKRLSVQHVVYEVKFSVSVKSQKNKKARLSCSRAYKYRVMTFLLRVVGQQFKKSNVKNEQKKSSFDRFSMYKRTHWFFLEGRLVKKVLVRSEEDMKARRGSHNGLTNAFKIDFYYFEMHYFKAHTRLKNVVLSSPFLPLYRHTFLHLSQEPHKWAHFSWMAGLKQKLRWAVVLILRW